MKIFFQILFLEFFPHPWSVQVKIGFGYRRFLILRKYNNFYHTINSNVICWRKQQIQKHEEMLRKQDQLQKLLKDRKLACQNDVNPASREYPDLTLYQKW